RKNNRQSEGKGRGVLPNGPKIRELRLIINGWTIKKFVAVIKMCSPRDSLSYNTLWNAEKGRRGSAPTLKLIDIGPEGGFADFILDPLRIKPRDPRPPAEPKVSRADLPTPLLSELFFGREEELERLDDAWKAETCRVVTVVGGWGTGKSALINEWLQQLEEE